MKKLVYLVVAICITTQVNAQNIEAYTIFNAKGKKVSYKKMLKATDASQVILFGELHNNPISHWFEYELTKSMITKNKMILGAEMFEADNQGEINQYLKGEIDAKALDTLARLWPNHTTDYKPLLDLAKDNTIEFIATNVPRRFARLVYFGGFEKLDSLSAEEKSWIAPLPPKYDKELPGYQEMLAMMGGHGGENLPKAQAIKDATMAYFLLRNLKEGQTFMHYNGAYHSQNYEGIMWYLQQEKPELTITTITTVEQKDVCKLLEENKGTADFIICVDENMTTTY